MIKNYAIETKQRDFAASFRSDLAASFRWAARLGFHEGVANHFSVAVPNSDSEFLINPSSRDFSRIKASDLILLDAAIKTARRGQFARAIQRRRA